jgi:hypothetical protein
MHMPKWTARWEKVMNRKIKVTKGWKRQSTYRKRNKKGGSQKRAPDTPPPHYERSEYEELNYQKRLRNEQQIKS